MRAIDTEGLDEQIRCEMCRNPMRTDRGCDGNCQYDEKLYERIMQILDERIKPLPSVQPEPHWIPATERLPEKSGWYITTEIAKDNFKYVREMWFSVCGGWRYYDPIAWMMLPEPYREEGE